MNTDASFYVGIGRLELHVPGARSLKEKRSHTRSLIERIRSRHQVLVSEVGHQDLYQRAAFAVCAFSADSVDVESRLRRVERTIDENWSGNVLLWDVEIIQV
jgi:uncharacterized protein YlxP (DUF503 family)